MEHELNTAATMRDMRSLYGGGQEDEDPKKWVFPKDGEDRSGAENFSEGYISLLLGHRKEIPPNHDANLYFDTLFEDDPSTGKEAAGLFFSYFETASGFFSHPRNLGKLALIVRHMMVPYAGKGIAEGIHPAVSKKLGELENELVEACPGGRAAMTDALRLLYNRSLALAVGSPEGREIGAGHLGPRGKALTVIGQPAALRTKMQLEEIDMARRGKIYCVDEKSGLAYIRGGWTESEWAEAKSRIEAETGKNPEAGAARLKAVDSFYFPQKIPYAVGSCFNVMRVLRDEIVLKCKTQEEFSPGQLLGRLKESSQAVAQQVYDEHGPSSEPYTIEAETIGDDEDLDTAGLPPKEPLALPPIGNSKEGTVDETDIDTPSSATGGGAGAAEPKKRVKSSVPLTPQKQAEKFLRARKCALAPHETELLENIFQRSAGFGPGDYCEKAGGFVKTTAYSGKSDPHEWRRNAAEARSLEEAEFIAEAQMPSGKSKTGVAIAAGDSVLLAVRGKNGKPSLSEISETELGRAEIRGGKLVVNGNSYKMVGDIYRAGYRAPEEETKSPVRPLGKGGIFGAITRLVKRGLSR